MRRTRLCLTRKLMQSVYIGDGPGSIVVTVLRSTDGHVRLAIEAPEDVKVLRDEVAQRDVRDAIRAAATG